jgi:hypothetical protein
MVPVAKEPYLIELPTVGRPARKRDRFGNTRLGWELIDCWLLHLATDRYV